MRPHVSPQQRGAVELFAADVAREPGSLPVTLDGSTGGSQLVIPGGKRG